MAANTTLNTRRSFNQQELLAWLNETLLSRFTEVEQLCSGAAYCQLIHLLFPASLDLSRVRFQSSDIVDSMHNYSLLQAAFRKLGVVRYVPTEALVKRSRVVSLTFLQWFRAFFNENKGNGGQASDARDGRSAVLTDAGGDQSSKSLVKTEEVEQPKEDLNNSPEMMIMISEDEGDVVPARQETREDCGRAANSEGQRRSSYTSDTLLFIRKYFGDRVGASLASSPSHPEDVIRACSLAPYCLYLYMGVELGAGRSTSLVLVGYFDRRSRVGVVRLLDALKMSVDLRSDAVAPAHTLSDAQLLVEALKTMGLALSNLSVFYCDAPHPAGSQVFVSQLQAFNPVLVSLCGLPGMAGRACHAGLLASFRCVVELIRAIHRHYSTWPCVNDSLKEIFADAASYDRSRPVSEQCSFIACTVHNMVSRWSDLVAYFTSVSQAEDLDLIRTQMMDSKVKLQVLFLFYSLEPLRALHELQQNSTADVSAELQLTSAVIHSYATSILRPSAAERFLQRRDLQLLCREKDLLPTTEVDVGSHARDFLQSSAVVDLGEQERTDFLKAAATFYKESLRSLVQSLPAQLGNEALKNLSAVTHPENRGNKPLSRQVLSETAVQLGLCSAGSPESHRLVSDCLGLMAAQDTAASCTGDGRRRAKATDGLRPGSASHRLFHILVAVPSTLRRKQVLEKVLHNMEAPPVGQWAPRTTPQRRRLPFQRRHEKKDDSSSDDGDFSLARPVRRVPSRHCIAVEDSDCTDNSSDVVDVTEMTRGSLALRQTGQRRPPPESVCVLVSDDDLQRPPTSAGLLDVSCQGVKGELVWAAVEGLSVWPAVVASCEGDNRLLRKVVVVEWYGQRTSSKVSLQDLKPFASFGQYFCAKSFATLITYREAIFFSLQEAALRCEKPLPACLDDREEMLRQMLDWAFGGFQPSGPEGLKPAASLRGVTKMSHRPKAKEKAPLQGTSSPQSSTSMSTNITSVMSDVAFSLNNLSCSSREKCSPNGRGERSAWEDGCDSAGKGIIGGMKEKGARGGWAARMGKRQKGGCEREREDSKVGWRGGKGHKKKGSLLDGSDDDTTPDKKRTFTKPYSKGSHVASVYTQPDQRVREETICQIIDMNLDLDGFCLCCGTRNVEICHPLFRGSLCLKCKDNFAETLYRYDEDGYQSYCTICCYGLEVVLCGNDSCCRSYCEYCLNILVGPGTFASLKELDPWICYLCQPCQPHGALLPREDWSIRVQEFFANNSAIEFEPHRVYPSIPASLRRPLRVLSLFDGIATGYLVLKELGFKVEKYVASEVCEDSIAVATVNHDGKIIHVGDSRFITQGHLEQWGPFDLLIGGSPCNDLSIVNPFRKGLYEGTGRLFFEYYRILHLLKPKEDEPRPFFWLFENVVFMNTHDKLNICRFLECNPVLVDAVKVSPAHRARSFWGNLPGMSRPIIASQNDKLNLQDCLETGREARVTKVRTITTNPNSLKQGKDVSLLPVLQNGKEDNLWITELEKIFGFPKHYTDVRNMNRQQRQKVLGKAWSVPVIRHLFAPLKDYFACEELPPLTSWNASSSRSVPSSASNVSTTVATEQ